MKADRGVKQQQHFYKWKKGWRRLHWSKRRTRIKGSWSTCWQHDPVFTWSVHSLMSKCCHIRRLSELVSFHQISSQVHHLGTHCLSSNLLPLLCIVFRWLSLLTYTVNTAQRAQTVALYGNWWLPQETSSMSDPQPPTNWKRGNPVCQRK